MQDADFTTLGLLLLVASLVAMLMQRLRLPYSVGLVIAGMLLALSPYGHGLTLTPKLIFEVFLPPLLFDASIRIHWRPFRRELPLLLTLVTIGIVMAAALVATGMHLFAGWSWVAAALFGVLIAATDPVAVIASFKENKVDDRLHLLVESESILNDGVAALGFAILVAIAAGAEVGPGAILTSFVKISVGGVICGLAVAGGLLAIAGRTRDPMVEISLTVLAAYGSFLLADHFAMSGVLATMAAGILVGNYGWGKSITPESKPSLLAFWDYAAFLANSLVFILIGSTEAKLPLLQALPYAALATVLALAGRAVAVYPSSLAFARTALAVPWRFKHILFWGGLRGALALALALAIPHTIPERGEIIAATFLVVAFSIFVQGLSMPWLLARMKLIQPAAVPQE